MFETLTGRFGDVFRRLSGRGRISEENVREAMAEVRTALLEADVHQEVARSFCDRVIAESIGREVTKSLKPGDEIIGVVHAELVKLLGEAGRPLMFVEPGPTIVMMCGLQGSGKTTTCGKLAAWLKQQGRSVIVAAADLQRPAAVEQLRTVVEQVEREGKGSARISFHGEPDKCGEHGTKVGVAVGVCQRALKRARDERFDVLILDTAGRLHIDDSLMRELEGVRRAVEPHQILLVVDAMTGQDAVNSAREFHRRLAVDGVILTKFDSDTRGGAALSVREVTGAPIRFVGVGEKLDALEEFHAERIAGRILGMGDVVSLVEKAQREVSEAEAE
ncbi:MAG: signal recognition particle protein, partial [Phycisphaerae bacterium]|nr:signal recognition particle protein [Phycisphaerae bacterium]